MPLLFISYKRGTDGIHRLMESLETEHYAVWFDRKDIYLGDTDWQISIERGIERSDGVILCLTPAATTSEPIRYEMAKASEFNKPIFPILLEPVEDIPAALVSLGLNPNAHVENFDRQDNHQQQFERLLAGLHKQQIIPTEYEIDLQGEKPEIFQRHQQYLSRIIIDRHVNLNLTETVNPEFNEGKKINVGDLELRTHAHVPIHEIYVPSPTQVRLVLEIEKYDIADWYITHDSTWSAGQVFIPLTNSQREQLRNETDQFAADMQAIGMKINYSGLQLLIEDKRQKLFNLKANARYQRLGRLDNAYEVIILNAHQVANLSKRTVFVGESGAGKTIFLRYLATALATPIVNTDLTLESYAHWTHGLLTPFYVHLQDALSLFETEGWTADTLWQHISRELSESGLQTHTDKLRSYLIDGHGILMLDGLDSLLSSSLPPNEMSFRIQQITQLLQSIENQFGNSRLVLTARSYVIPILTPGRYLIVTLAEFDTVKQRQLIENMYKACFDLVSSPTETKKHAIHTNDINHLINELASYSNELSGNARFIALLVTLYPQHRGILYRATVKHLIDTWTQDRPGMPSLKELLKEETSGAARESLLNWLSKFAYDTMLQFPEPNPSADSLKPIFAEKVLDLLALGISFIELQGYLSSRAGILVKEGNSVRFAHEGFRQYLAAEYILSEVMQDRYLNRDDGHTLLRELVQEQPDAWEQVSRILGDLVTTSDLLTILDDLVDDHMPEVIDSSDPRYLAVWIAARLTVDKFTPAQIQKMTKRDRTVIEDITEWLTNLINDPEAPHNPKTAATDWPRRIEAGRLLSQLGDWRPGVGVRQGVPDVTWVSIEEGNYQPTVPNKKAEKTEEKQELSKIYLPAYRVSKYPVTVAQYQAFIDAEGYTTDHYWSVLGLEWRGEHRQYPDHWEDSEFHFANHPIIGVTYYEAEAFCNWLNHVQSEWENIRLPTEAEWERAARGMTTCMYPYGDIFDPFKANSRLTDVNRSTAVGIFQYGNSENGISDLSGNAYEWCVDIHPDDAKELDPVKQRRALRGGSWASYPGFTRTDSRYYDYPFITQTYWGFRIVADS